MSTLAFRAFRLHGVDAQKFLQGQVTLHVERLAENQTRYTGICNLKGRVQFGLWLKKITAEDFEIISTADLADELAKHIKKFGAFSKMKLEEIGSVYPQLTAESSEFSIQETDIHAWALQAIQAGQAWIDAENSAIFQPQELRLHQRDGVHYDKGCYLGQEIVARLWFKAKPKHWLHLIQGTNAVPASAEQLDKDVQVVNAIATEQGYIALVVAKPEALQTLAVQIIDLPSTLNGDVARP